MSSYDQSDDSSSESLDYHSKIERKRKKNATKWVGRSKELKSTSQVVFVLTHKYYDHRNRHNTTSDNIGVFNSKDAAVAAATDYKTGWGPFDDAIDGFGWYTDYIDNRDNPPDDGVLLQLGGEADYDCFTIKKMEIKGFDSINTNEKMPKAEHLPGAKFTKRSRVEHDDSGDDNNYGSAV